MSERQSLLLAGVAHLALFAALSLGLHLTPPPAPADAPVPVEFVEISDTPRVTEREVAQPAPATPPPPAPEPAPTEPEPRPDPAPEPADLPPPVARDVPVPDKPKPPRLDASALSTLLDKSLPKAVVKPPAKPLDTAALARSIDAALPRSARVDPRATATLIQAIRAQVAPCWNPPIAAAGAAKMTVVLRIEMNRDGSVVGRPGIVSQTGVTAGNADYARTFAETARRAVLRCAPLKLPAAMYDAWKAVEINFDPSEMA